MTINGNNTVKALKLIINYGAKYLCLTMLAEVCSKCSNIVMVYNWEYMALYVQEAAVFLQKPTMDLWPVVSDIGA